MKNIAVGAEAVSTMKVRVRTTNTRFQRSENFGASFPTSISSFRSSYWNTYMVLNSDEPSVFYIHRKSSPLLYDVFRTFDRGDNFERISDFTGPPHNLCRYRVSRMHTAPSDPDYLYVHVLDDSSGVRIHRLFKSTKANDTASVVIASWTEISLPMDSDNLPLPLNRWIGEIAVAESDPDVFWIALSGFEDVNKKPPFKNKVWKYDSGWMDLTYNLPNASVKQIITERGSDEALYVGTNFGVFYTNNARLSNPATAWVMFGSKLPHAEIQELESNYVVNKLRVGLAGRGVWESDLYCPEDDDLYVPGALASTRFFETTNNLTSDATVNPGADIVFRAGRSITLNPGFEVAEGADFHAFIHPCDRPGNSSGI